MDKFLNFNIGVLGHVDSGKTSLSIALSSIASTAAFDKNPQSKERGITIDLGFSSFCIDASKVLKDIGFTKVQYTLVDCPGHASLIRTIIGGAQIIDIMMLVIDVTKGIQTQTAECIILGEILCKKLLVVLNKIDLVPREKLNATCSKITKRIQNVLSKTKFVDAKLVSIAANPGGSEARKQPIGIDNLINEIIQATFIPDRSDKAPLAFSVDHCFAMKGQGTVITGTILQGTMVVNSNIDIPSLKIIKKVKSIQMFRRPVEKAGPGDRIGICITQFDPKLLERGLIGSNECIHIINGFIAKINVISYYKHVIKSKAKFHISVGHDTIMSQITLFSSNSAENIDEFDFSKEYLYRNEINKSHVSEMESTVFYALVEFEKSIPALKNSLFIASKLDMDVNTSMCRLAFWGIMLIPLQENYKSNSYPTLKVYKDKAKEGMVERANTENGELIVKNLLKKGTDINLFIGLKVTLSTGENGIIDGNFGLSGKTKVRITENLKEGTKTKLNEITDNKKKGKKNEKVTRSSVEDINVYLKFKKFMFNPTKKIVQS